MPFGISLGKAEPCRDCGNLIGPRADICAHCGRPTTATIRNTVFGVCLMLIVIYFAITKGPLF